MEKIKIIDFYSIKTFHEIFNLSLIGICSNIADKVIYKTSLNYGNNIKSKLTPIKCCQSAKIDIVHKPMVEIDSKMGSLIRQLFGFWICLWEFISLKKNTLLIFNYINYFSLPIILLVNRYFKKDVIFTMHGELGLIEKDVPKHKVSGIYKSIISIVLKHLLIRSNAYILVLGDSIKRNIIALYPNLSNCVISVCHPVFNVDVNSWSDKSKGEKLVVGTAGAMNKNKGFDLLIELSKLLKEEILSNKLELRCIGKVDGENIEKYPLIKWMHPHDLLSRDEFEKNIKELDFILYLYNQASYKYCASGALFDALICHRPIITLQNDYFDYILSGNEIGFKLQSIELIAEKIRALTTNNPGTKYFCEGFEKLVHKTSITEIGKTFHKQLIDRGIY